MSAFLFYKPNSNPNRFSRKERFSRQLHVSPVLDNSPNRKDHRSSNIPADSISASPVSLDNDCATAQTNMLTHDPPDTQHNSNASIVPQDDGRDLLHSLFSGSDMDCEGGALGLVDQDIRCRDDIQDCSGRDNTANRLSPSPNEIFPTDQGAFPMPLQGCDTLDKRHSNQQELNEHGLESIVGEVNMQSASSYYDQMQVYTSNYEECHSLEGRIAGSLSNMEFLQNAAECPTKIADVENRTHHLRSGELSLPSKRDLVSTRSRSYSPPRPAKIAALAEWSDDMYSCRPSPRSTVIRESDMGSQQSEPPSEKALSALISVANSATASTQPMSVSQPDIDMVIEDTSQSCLMTTSLPGRESNAITSHGHNNENAEAGSGLCVTETDTPTPSTAQNMLVTGDQQTPLSSSPYSIQPREIEFSHVEIRNVRTTEQGGPVEVNDGTTSGQVGDIRTSCANGPWRLDGTILSVDIREAERIPVFVGYSTYRVVDGQLIQSITLVQGNTELPYAENPMCKVTQERGYGTKKTCKADPTTNNRAPLSLKQKRDLVRLKEEGYTWNEITSRFPGRKKGTLQGIYYTQLKDFRNRIGQTHQHKRRRLCLSDRPYTKHPHRTTGLSVKSRIQPAQTTENPRYSFRARRVAWS